MRRWKPPKEYYQALAKFHKENPGALNPPAKKPKQKKSDAELKKERKKHKKKTSKGRSRRKRGLRLSNPCEKSGPVIEVMRNGVILVPKRFHRAMQSAAIRKNLRPKLREGSLVGALRPLGSGEVPNARPLCPPQEPKMAETAQATRTKSASGYGN